VANQIETWFGILIRQAIYRGSFDSVTELVTELVAMIDAFSEQWNAGASPFAWGQDRPRDPRQGRPQAASDQRFGTPVKNARSNLQGTSYTPCIPSRGLERMNLEGKTVIITGAGHGLGRAYAVACAAEGANVACADIDDAAVRTVATSIGEAGGSAIAVRTDVTDNASVVRLADATAERFGGIDGLVNNAAIMGVIPMSRVSFEEIPDEEWDRVFATNVKGTWSCCKAVVPYLRRRGGGSIVNISSGTSFLGSPTRIHYVASKSAIIGFTRTLAREVGPELIRVNAIAPGSVLSEERPTPEVIEHRRRSAKDQAINHVLEAADLVGTVVFLLSDASRYLTGQTIVVDGGDALN
jgi:3-oxoacyl-[acyl-carrier protein] reductase